MPLSTSRRRLLITAPLAVILPAGLIIYLGWRGINIMEKTLSPFVNGDIQTHQQTIDDCMCIEMNQREHEFFTAFQL